jgi:hypothetical protein
VPGPRSSWRSIVLVVVSVVAAAAGVACAVLLLQPWRSCPEIDDSFLACPMTAPDTTLLLVSLVTLAAAMAVVAITASRSAPAQAPRHRPAGPVRYGLVGEPSTDAADASTSSSSTRRQTEHTGGDR